MEGADERRVGACVSASQPTIGRDRLVHVDDVVAARRAARGAASTTASGVTREVRDRAVGRAADRAAERDQPLGHARAPAGRAPRCRRARQAVVGVERARARATSWPGAAQLARRGPRCGASRPPGTSTSTGTRGRSASRPSYDRRGSRLRVRLTRSSSSLRRSRHARAPLRQVHVPEGRPGLAAPATPSERARRQARVPRRLRGLRRRAPAARVLARRHARRRRPDAAHARPRTSSASTSSTSCSPRAG